MSNQVSEKMSVGSQNWRDLSPKDAKKQLYIRVGFAALAVVIALAVAGSCYYLATHTETVRFIGGGCGGGPAIPVEPFERSLAPLCLIPGVLGAMVFAGAVTGAIVYKVEGNPEVKLPDHDRNLTALENKTVN